MTIDTIIKNEFEALESEKLISPVVKKGGNYMAMIAKGEYYAR